MVIQKMRNKETIQKFSVEFRMTPDNKSVRFYNPSAGNIPMQLFSAILKALEQVEKTYHGYIE